MQHSRGGATSLESQGWKGDRLFRLHVILPMSHFRKHFKSFCSQNKTRAKQVYITCFGYDMERLFRCVHLQLVIKLVDMLCPKGPFQHFTDLKSVK